MRSIKSRNKRGVLGIPFSWLFAIIVGAIIIFAAIYGAGKLIKIKNLEADIETSKQLSVIFEPMRLGEASGKSGVLEFQSETRIYNLCYLDKVFGYQKLPVSTKLGLGKEDWSKKADSGEIRDNYVFSEEVEQGKKFWFFSTSFEFPFKVSNLIILSSKEYCFLNPPEFIAENIGQGKLLKNAYISEKINNFSCKPGDAKVCFSNEDCDIRVTGLCSGYECELEKEGFDFGYILKEEKRIDYHGNLIYAAIFSAPEIYECNVKRLSSRIVQIAYLYAEEAGFLESKGCGGSIKAELMLFGGRLENLNSSSELKFMWDRVQSLNNKNSALGYCKIW